MVVSDNRLCIVAPSFAGESGFEFIRQYGGNQPMGLIIDYLEDGRIGVESVTDSYLRGYKVKNPEVKKNGIENFIHNSINQEAVVLGRENPEMKKMYRRDIVTKK